MFEKPGINRAAGLALATSAAFSAQRAMATKIEEIIITTTYAG